MKRKFAFMIHPRQISDFHRRLGNMLGMSAETGMKVLPKLIPNTVSEAILKRLPGRLGFTVCSHFDALDTAEGYIIAILLTGKQMTTMPRHIVERRIMDGITFAWEYLGVERVGLGAYTAPYTNNGLSVVNSKRVHCAVTHGDGLSAASSIVALEQGAEIKDIDVVNATIAVVGAYGITGRGAAILSSKLNPKKMILTGPNKNKLGKVQEEIASHGFTGEIEMSQNNVAIASADIVILATTAPGSIVVPTMLKKNCVVVDMSQPHNMGMDVCQARPDILRIDGGYMAIPGVDLGFEMGPPKEVTFACLTETMTSTLIQDKDDHVGPVDVNFASTIYDKAQEFGFKLAPLTCFSKPIIKPIGLGNIDAELDAVGLSGKFRDD